jgi:transcription antitermination factor NusG
MKQVLLRPTAEGLQSAEQEFRWYALRVRPRHEKTVFAQLAAKAQEAFLPLCTVRHRWADRWKNVSLPLFPGYVFSRFDMQRQAGILAMSSVIDVVRVGSQPAPLDPAEIEAIRIAAAGPLHLESFEGLLKGQHVTITEGPFKGLAGTLVEIRRSFRLALSLELLNRSVLVEIDSSWIHPIDRRYGAAQIQGLPLSSNPGFHAVSDRRNGLDQCEVV